MMPLLVVLSLALIAFALYLAALSARHAERPEHHLDAGLALPGWTLIFASAGVALSAFGLVDHLRLIGIYGLQYSQVAVGAVLVAGAAALVQKRVWFAARLLGLRTLGEIMGAYFGSVALRVLLLVLLLLFAVPFAGYALGEAGAILGRAGAGAIGRTEGIWACGFFLFLFSAIGGWRAVVYVVAAQSFLALVLLVLSGAFAANGAGGPLAAFVGGDPTPEGILRDAIPGVIQFSAGIGKGTAAGGIWTTVGILSSVLAVAGVVFSPNLNFLALTTKTRRGFAFAQVWVVAGLVGGALLLLGPVLASQLGPGAGLAAFDPLAETLAARDALVAACFLFLLLVSLQTTVAFFAGSSASIVTIELVDRFVLPDLSGAGRRLAARIALAAIYGAAALAASFAPTALAVLAPLALSLSVQLLPAFLGLCWLPWISRSGVLSGLVMGILLVVFTEPAGIAAFEALFVELPWGRWPLTIHSAGWGLAFNVAACLLVSLATRGGPERERRERLHDGFAELLPRDRGGRSVRDAQWSLALLWTFLALGPGAILGNTFFSQPVFTETTVALGVPSLFAWQILFWLVGVVLVWWLAYPGRMSIVEAEPRHRIRLANPAGPLEGLSRPPWIGRVLRRVAAR